MITKKKRHRRPKSVKRLLLSRKARVIKLKKRRKHLLPKKESIGSKAFAENGNGS